jgi:sirohydrochlorin cobaltochelatase
LLLIGHGSSEDDRVGEPVRQLADQLADLDAFDEVAVAFVREEPRVEGAIERCEADEVVVVPILMSQGYFADRVVPERLGLGADEREDVSEVAGRRVVYLDAIGTDPSMVEIVDTRIREALEGEAVGPGGVAVVVTGHGTTAHEDSSGSTERVVAELDGRGDFGEVRAAFLDEPPGVVESIRKVEYGNIVVVPFFLAEGPHVAEEIPEMLGSEESFDGFPREVDGHRVWYTRPVGTSSHIAGLVAARAYDGLERLAGASPAE